MLKESKQPNHVLGFKEKCPNFVQCPICYGCRNYSTHDLNCEQCAINSKKNICNTSLHRTDLIDKLISKDSINIDSEENVTFLSVNKKEDE